MTEEQRARVRGAVEATRTGWRQSVREVCWTLGLLDDEGNPSLSRVFAAFFMLASVHGRLWDELPVTLEDIGMGFLAATSYLGIKGLAIFGRTASRRSSGAMQSIPDAGSG